MARPRLSFQSFLWDAKLRIFIIENLQHNYKWLKLYSKYFRDTDHFIVIVGFYVQEVSVVEADEMFKLLNLSKSNFHILYNDDREFNLFKKYNFKGEVINHNCWLDENNIMQIVPRKKLYNSIYCARLVPFKRHYLASKVENLALIAGDNTVKNPENIEIFVPSHSYINDRHLSPTDVCIKMNESFSGLILSEAEGACFSSSEYLLCGIPVVSTHSFGGRDVWYDEYNSLIVNSDVDSVAEAVQFFVDNVRDPFIIRENHIKLAKKYRSKFVDLLESIVNSCGVNYIDAKKYFDNHYYHKMRNAYVPNLEHIFINSDFFK